MIDSTKHNYNILKVIVILVLMCISHFSLLAQNPGDLIWESKVSNTSGGRFPLPPLSMNSSDETIYCGSSALNGKTGKLLWISDVLPFSQFSVGKHYLYAFNSHDNGNVNAVNKRNGKIVWQFKTKSFEPPQYYYRSDNTILAPSIGIDGNDHIYFGDSCFFYCINGSTGKLIWDFKYNHNQELCMVTPSLGNDGTVYFLTDHGKIFGLYKDIGELKWVKELAYGSGYFNEIKLIDNNEGYINGHQLSINLLNGNSQYLKIPSGDSNTDFDKNCYLIDHYNNSHKIKSYNYNNGLLLWEFVSGGFIETAPTITSNAVYFISDSLYALDIKTGNKKWHNDERKYTGEVIVSEQGMLYCVGKDRLFAIKTDSKPVHYGWPMHGQNSRRSNSVIYNKAISPKIVGQPTGSNLILGSSYTFNIAVEGANLTYTWYKNEKTLFDSTDPIFRVNKAEFSDTGTYQVLVQNENGQVLSDKFKISVNNIKSGDLKWSKYFIGDLMTIALGHNKILYVANANPNTGGMGMVKNIKVPLYALYADSGDKKWEVHLKDGGLSPVIDEDGTIFTFPYALDGESGEIKWMFDKNDIDYFSGPPVIGKDRVIYYSNGRQLRALDLEKQKNIWSIAQLGIREISLDNKGSIIFLDSIGVLLSSEIKNGQINWSKLGLFPPAVADITIGNDKVYLINKAYNTGDGSIEWGNNKHYRSRYAVLGYDNVLYNVVGANNDWVFNALDSQTGVLIWSLKVGKSDTNFPDPYASPPITLGENTAYFKLNKNYRLSDGSTELTHSELIAVNLNSRKIEWKYDLGTGFTRHSYPVVDLSGNIYFIHDSKLFGLEGSDKPSNSVWPMVDQNSQRTGSYIKKSNISPSILQHPDTQVIDLNEKVLFKVIASGDLPLRYEWSKDDSVISGANKKLYSIESVKMQHAGRYEVLVSNDHGSIKSNAATLTVLEPGDDINPPQGIPVIAKQPKSKIVWPGQSLTFLVEATGAKPMTYQWFQDQAKLKDKNDKSLTIINVEPSKHIGGYTVVIENSFGSVKSDVARLKVIAESELYITKKIFTVGDKLVFQAETPMTGGKVDVERSFDFNNWEKLKSVASVGLITVVVNMENDKQMFYRLKIAD